MRRDREQQELARLGELCVQGGIAEAELSLHDWCRHDAPAAARLLLAALLARRGADAHALAILERAAHHGPEADAELTRLFVALLIKTGLLDTAGRLVRTLHDTHGHHPAIAQWLQWTDSLLNAKLASISHASVEHLAAELIESPHMIPSLVVAAMLPDSDLGEKDVELLRSAIQRVAADAADDRQMLVICQAMAQLALLQNDPDDARRWAHRGLKLDPYQAALALILSRIDDDLAVGPTAAEVLRRVAVAHPAYADIRASLILRERRDGRSEAAQIKLAQWLEQDPANPHALGLVRELAA